eukprot:32253-Eustigmatos_ZCMA.PRE.1
MGALNPCMVLFGVDETLRASHSDVEHTVRNANGPTFSQTQQELPHRPDSWKRMTSELKDQAFGD